MRGAPPLRSLFVLLITALLTGVCGVVAASPSHAGILAAAPPTTDVPCRDRPLPPAPVDTSEKPPSGEASPEPPPIPQTPAGGQRMAECGTVRPAGGPAPPDEVTAEGWLVQDLDTGHVLAAKDPHGRYRPASLIKTLLALAVLEELPLEHTVVATQEDADQECTCVGLVEGGEYTVETLVEALLMRSGNDVAHALAAALGGIDAAVDKMNALAESLGTTDTHAATPSGLDGPGMMTSAYDMSLIFRHALEQPAYAEAVGTKERDFPGGPGEPGFPIYNDNQLWSSYDGFLGGKTGFTDDARHTYAGAAEHDGRRIAVVLLRAEQEPVRVSEQAGLLLDYGFALAAAGSNPVGTITTAPADSAERGDVEADPDLLGAGDANEDDAFGTTGWIVTLIMTLIVLAGLLAGHRKGLLRRPD